LRSKFGDNTETGPLSRELEEPDIQGQEGIRGKERYKKKGSEANELLSKNLKDNKRG
jgi:hypothetical protein